MAVRHVGIIMDGNRRWARLHEVGAEAGYAAGATTLASILARCIASDVEVVSVFALSTENVARRSPDELSAVIGVISDFLKNGGARGARVRFCGETDVFGADFQNLCAKAAVEADSAEHFFTTLNICLNYGGQEEVFLAAKSLFESGLPFSPDNYRKALQSGDLPPLDLIIRTGGEKRLSNFLLYSSAYAELFFSDKLWPDFTPDDLTSVLDGFAARKRNFGGN